MSMCSRPQIETQLIAGREVARCLSCAAISPPDQAEQWSTTHRDEATAANQAIDGAGVGDDPWPDVTELVNEVNARPTPEPIAGPPF